MEHREAHHREPEEQTDSEHSENVEHEKVDLCKNDQQRDPKHSQSVEHEDVDVDDHENGQQRVADHDES